MARSRSLRPHLPAVPRRLGLRWTRDTDALRRFTAVGYLVGASAAAFSVLAPDPDPSDHRGLLILMVLDLVMAAVLWYGERLPEPVIRALCLSGAIVFTTAAAVIARPSEVVLLFYLWPALQLGNFGTGREFVGNGILFTFALGVAVHFGAFEVQAVTYVVAFDVMLIAAVVMFALRRYSEGLVRDLEAAATHDDLTGLLNRRAFLNAMERELRHAAATDTPLSLAIFDLDHFKRINDQHGHAGGDDALRLVAEVLREVTGEHDAIGRHGGEEFTLLLPGRGLREAATTAQRVATTLEERSARTPTPLSTSAGVASVGPGRREAEQLFAAADHALYAAKDAGRRRVFVAPDITPVLRTAA